MTKRTYKVIGPAGYAGHQPGETFDAELDEHAERRALERGSIKRVEKKSPTTKRKEEATDE